MVQVDFELSAEQAGAARSRSPGIVPDIELVSTTDVSGYGAAVVNYLPDDALEADDGPPAAVWTGSGGAITGSAADDAMASAHDQVATAEMMSAAIPGIAPAAVPMPAVDAAPRAADDAAAALASLGGQYAVLTEIVVAILTALPGRESVLRLGLRNAQRLRDPDEAGAVDPAWLQGVDQEIANFEEISAILASKQRI
ncbi:MAG: hypothetical protein JNM90_19860 [Burkholderiales bacterium]|nr:hypothetical protein [Burkholderiales bacterium]